MMHSDRIHATWSASATARNTTCPGALAIAIIAPDEKRNIYSATGTCAHEVADACLTADSDAIAALGVVKTIDGFEIEVDEQMVEGVQTYLDYVRSLPGNWAIEERFTLNALDPPFDAGGTCDFIAIDGSVGLAEVVDFKYGKTPVEANENAQLKSYALMALLNLPKETQARIQTIKSTIVQPRAWHREGAIRSETYHVADLIGWSGDLLAAMARSKAALDDFEAINGNRDAFDAWAKAYLQVGACDWCPAMAICPARKADATKIAPEQWVGWVEDATLPAVIETLPPIAPITPEQLGHILDGLSSLEDWIAAVRAYAHQLAEAGVTIPGWAIVNRIGHRRFKDEQEAVARLMTLGLKEDQIYSRKLVSPAQAEKLLGAKRKKEIADIYEKPITGTNLVSVKKTERAPLEINGFVETVEN